MAGNFGLLSHQNQKLKSILIYELYHFCSIPKFLLYLGNINLLCESISNQFLKLALPQTSQKVIHLNFSIMNLLAAIYVLNMLIYFENS